MASTTRPPRTLGTAALSHAGCWSAAFALCKSGAARTTGFPAAIGTATKTSPKIMPTWPREWTKPAAALIQDLKSLGLLEDTIVYWTTEFGRMPCSQGGKGRDHNPFSFTSWLAGGGVKGRHELWGKR